MRVDTDRAASLGVTARSIGSTLQALMSERQVTTYVVDGEEYDVVLMAEPKQRASYADLSNIFVRSERSAAIPTARGWKASYPRRSINWASDRRDWVAMRRPSPCMSSWPPPTSR